MGIAVLMSDGAARSGREGPPRDLILGLVAPMGADCRAIYDALFDELRVVGYQAAHIKISRSLEKYLKEANPALLAGAGYLQRKKVLMDAGNEFRKIWGSGDALAFLAMSRIREERAKSEGESTGRAYVIDSLKHPAEIETLKAVYGPAFVAIGVYAPPDLRFEFIAGQRTLLKDIERELRDHLIQRDQDEQDKLGQRVRPAFELTDAVIDARPSRAPAEVRRLLELLFGNKLKTPTRDEYGMAAARAAQARSGSLARQIGAAIVREDGAIIALGFNEVAKPNGGQYEEADDPDFMRGRDIPRGEDSSDWFRQRALSDIIRLLQEQKIIKASEDPEVLFKRWYFPSKKKSDPTPFLRDALVMNTIDYIRAVHAETAALFCAARIGVSVSGATLYTTTFPCHDCAKAIVASGIREVVYWAPYPKSLVADLYDDSIEIDALEPNEKKIHFHSFVGVAPNRYADFFIMGKRERKLVDGKADVFDSRTAELTLPGHAVPEAVSLLQENSSADQFLKTLRRLKKQLHSRLRKIKRTSALSTRRKRRVARRRP